MKSTYSVGILALGVALLGSACARDTAGSLADDPPRKTSGALSRTIASESVAFDEFNEMVVTSDAIVVGTVVEAASRLRERSGGAEPERRIVVSIRTDEQIYGTRSAPGGFTIHTFEDEYGSDRSEWRASDTRVIVFLGYFPADAEKREPPSPWMLLNGQGVFRLDGEDIESTSPPGMAMTNEVASWSLDEFKDMVREAEAAGRQGRVRPKPDPRKEGSNRY